MKADGTPTLKEFATELGISVGTAWNLKREGMPTELVAARAWLELRNTNKRKQRFFAPDPIDTEGVEPDSLEDSLERIRGLEKALAQAATRAFKEGKVPEAITLRREHVTAIKALYDAETKLIKINEIRGKLISVDHALGLINGALQSAILVLRRLPDLGRDSEERKRLEAFMHGVLAEIKLGAAEGLNRAA